MAHELCPWEDIPPGPGFVRVPLDQLPIARTQVGSLPENFHTGGAVGSIWHPANNPNELWKPLDYGSYPHHIEEGDRRRWATNEWAALEVLRRARKPGAQMNARRETGTGGRQWLVMPRYYADLKSTNWDDLLGLEQTVWWYNSRGWDFGDNITVMWDETSWGFVFVDLSCADFHPATSGCYAADDRDKWIAWLRAMGATHQADLREHGRRKLHRTWLEHPGRANRTHDDPFPHHVYVSYYRPFSLAWADQTDRATGQDLRRAFFEHNGAPYHTTIGTVEPLSEDYCKRYELTWAWSTIHYQIETGYADTATD